jgi:hypothetical protein
VDAYPPRHVLAVGAAASATLSARSVGEHLHVNDSEDVGVVLSPTGTAAP